LNQLTLDFFAVYNTAWIGMALPLGALLSFSAGWGVPTPMGYPHNSFNNNI